MSSSEVTQALAAIEAGDPRYTDELLPLVYEELRRLAAARMAALPPGQTLQPTALVHDAFVRLVGTGPSRWNSRGHFFSAAAEAMRRILIEKARKKSAQKRGGELRRVDLDGVHLATNAKSDQLLAMDEALQRYTDRDRQGAELIKLRFYLGFSNSEAAGLMGISDRTAKRTWAYARAWLLEELSAED